MNSAVQKLAFVALGSNLGNSRETIYQTMARLQDFSSEILLKSSLWQTTPVDCPPNSPLFLNAVVGMNPFPNETPESLVQKLQQLEIFFGRQQKIIINEPRPLDLDLISFGNETRASKQLVLPHPRAHERRFVLQPLSEIAPNLILPHQPKTVIELLDQLRSEEKLSRLD